MLTRVQLRDIAEARIADARVLLRGERFDGAVYLCGYAVELALKARIVSVLKWSGFPESNNEFNGLQSFKIHDLDKLLHLTGSEKKIRTKHMVDWSIVAQWDPEARYSKIGSATRTQAEEMIQAAEALLRVI